MKIIGFDLHSRQQSGDQQRENDDFGGYRKSHLSYDSILRDGETVAFGRLFCSDDLVFFQLSNQCVRILPRQFSEIL